jgi:cell division protein ZapA
MSKTVYPVSLNILDKEYRIACATDEREELIKSAQELDKQMRRIRDTGKVNGADRIAVLAALNLAHDLNAAAVAAADPDLTARVVDLRQKIENVLENP